jgi:5'-3' exoribonuclease 1
MGVPGFFLWLMKKYDKEFIFDKIDDNLDYLLIDTNCLIHPMCFKVLEKNNNIIGLEEKMMKQVIEYIEYLIEHVKPGKATYIAIDGVAPCAKIKQQRYRRFKSISDKILFDKIKKKYNKPVSETIWNNSAISPGTEFMYKLHCYINNWIKERKDKIIYSSYLTPGEGEHKLLEFIKNNNDNDNYVIYGLDADLIFLALTSSSNIHLLRESNELTKTDSISLKYVSINVMKESIYSTISNIIDYDIILCKDNIIKDFIFMCYLLGNDFLPHIHSIDIYDNGLDLLIDKYSDTLLELFTSNNNYYYLLDNYNVNMDFFKVFILKLSLEEESCLKEKFIKNKKYRMLPDDPFDKEMFKIDNLLFKIDDPIKLGSDNHIEWRKRYYKNYFDTDNPDEISKKIVLHYLAGLKWTTFYYFDKQSGCPSWEWYYPFDNPPFLSDIYNYLVDINTIKFDVAKPIEPFMQLLIVLPPQLNYLLPNNLRKLMSNPKSSLSYLYPYEFEQDFLNKKKYWMGTPKLPSLDINDVKYYYLKYKNELTKEELERNNINI